MASEPQNSIPRIIHQIWLGSPVPVEISQWMESWKKLHAGWEYRLWTEANMPPLENQAQFDSARAWAVKADLARVEILQQYGGVYVDADYECFRPIDRLIENATALVLSEGDGSITNSLVGSTVAHPLLSSLITEMGRIDPEDMVSSTFDPLPWTGPKLWTRLISEKGLVFSNDFRLLPPDYFVTPKTRIRQLVELSELRRYGTHHALATWRSEGGLVDLLRRTRLRTRLRRFLDLTAA